MFLSLSSRVTVHSVTQPPCGGCDVQGCQCRVFRPEAHTGVCSCCGHGSMYHTRHASSHHGHPTKRSSSSQSLSSHVLDEVETLEKQSLLQCSKVTSKNLQGEVAAQALKQGLRYAVKGLEILNASKASPLSQDEMLLVDARISSFVEHCDRIMAALEAATAPQFCVPCGEAVEGAFCHCCGTAC